ncbi:MAG: hypothetical protein ACRD9L_20850 [Bryobacteraceae bacterium]
MLARRAERLEREGISEAERMADFRRWTQAKLEGVRCPAHGRGPRVSFRGTTLHEMTISLSGCCNRLSALANRAIAGSIPGRE